MNDVVYQPIRYIGNRPVYFSGRAPDGLATRRQLRNEGLSAAGLAPVAYIQTYLHNQGPLFERDAARPVRVLTENQRRALEAGRAKLDRIRFYRTCSRCVKEVHKDHMTAKMCHDCEEQAWKKKFSDDHQHAAQWAKEVLSDPEAIILDTETTDLDGYIVEIAVVKASTGAVLLNCRLNPDAPISPGAHNVHGISNADVADQPHFTDIAEDLLTCIAPHRLIIYNANFDLSVLEKEVKRAKDKGQTGAVWNLLETVQAECAMEQYAQWYGQWHPYWGNYTWQPLGGGHAALDDCHAVCEKLQNMATNIPEQHSRLKSGPAPFISEIRDHADDGIQLVLPAPTFDDHAQ